MTPAASYGGGLEHLSFEKLSIALEKLAKIEIPDCEACARRAYRTSPKLQRALFLMQFMLHVLKLDQVCISAERVEELVHGKLDVHRPFLKCSGTFSFNCRVCGKTHQH